MPTLATGNRFPIHAGCGGKGCDDCTHTGYAAMGAVALANLEARCAASDGPGPRNTTEPAAKPAQPTLF